LVVASTAAVAGDARKTMQHERKEDNSSGVWTGKNETQNEKWTGKPDTMQSE
jgi:hypothetical protein